MKTRALALLLTLLLPLCACVAAGESGETATTQPAFVPQRVVALSSSLAEIWLLAGGTLVGTSSDTLERGFSALPSDIPVVGTVKDPSLEAILELRPDFVILSADIAGHVALEPALKDARIYHHYAHVETFDDYLSTLSHFCALTANDDLFTQNGTAVANAIRALLTNYMPAQPQVTYLLLRVSASGGKVIAGDHVVCDIMTELNALNVAASNQSLLSDLSLEAILESDPDIILVVTMGDEAAALETLEQVFTAQPAWQRLSAVADNRVHVLDKTLFHYKPNARWAEAYEALMELVGGR